MPTDLTKDFKLKKKEIRTFKQLFSDKEDQLNNLRLNELVGDDVSFRIIIS